MCRTNDRDALNRGVASARRSGAVPETVQVARGSRHGFVVRLGAIAGPFVILARGTVLAQIITLAGVPLLARLYDAAAFGVYGAVSTTLLALSTIACGRYEQAIIPARSESEATRLVVLSLAVSAQFSIIILLVIIFLRAAIVG